MSTDSKQLQSRTCMADIDLPHATPGFGPWAVIGCQQLPTPRSALSSADSVGLTPGATFVVECTLGPTLRACWPPLLLLWMAGSQGLLGSLRLVQFHCFCDRSLHRGPLHAERRAGWAKHALQAVC